MAPRASLKLACLALAAAAFASPALAQSPADLARRAVERRAVEAVIWGMPVVNYDLMRQEMDGDGGAFGHRSRSLPGDALRMSAGGSDNYGMTAVPRGGPCGGEGLGRLL